MGSKKTGKLEFDPEIIRKHINAEIVHGWISSTMDGYSRGVKKSFNSPLPSAEEMGTDEALQHSLPHIFHHDALQLAVLQILGELRDQGKMRPVPFGAERGVREAVEWNRFVEKGPADAPKYGWSTLFHCPLPQAISQGIFEGAYDCIRQLRTDAGLDPHSAHDKSGRTGAKALMPVGPEHVSQAAAAAAERAVLMGSGAKRFFSMSSEMRCPKTDQRLTWKSDSLLEPVAGIMHYGNRMTGETTRFEELGPWDAPKPLRHLKISAPSGRIYMADWFRIPGFNEGINDQDEYSRTSINADKGVDERTQDHYERLGLMRIHTTNCVPQVTRDGIVYRIGWIDEDHEDLWDINPDDPSDYSKKDGAWPDVIGQVCCDLWDVTFADREILIDILVAGGQRIAENGGIGDRDEPVQGAPTTREEAGTLLDEYAKNNSVAVIETEPGSELNVYMATGHGSTRFFKHFGSPDLVTPPWSEDMFLISTKELSVDPSKVDEAGWVWPERYAAPDADAVVGLGS